MTPKQQPVESASLYPIIVRGDLALHTTWQSVMDRLTFATQEYDGVLIDMAFGEGQCDLDKLREALSFAAAHLRRGRYRVLVHLPEGVDILRVTNWDVLDPSCVLSKQHPLGTLLQLLFLNVVRDRQAVESQAT